MNKVIYIITAAAAILAVGCKKEKIDPAQPSIAWESNAGFGVVELTGSLDAAVTAYAPGQFQEVKLVLGLGNYNILANPYIQISSNKGGTVNPVLDLVNDASSISFVNGLGMSVGQSLHDRTETKLNLRAILEKILEGQVVENNTTFTIEIRVTDKNGKLASKTARFHFTAAPTISWPKNPGFSVVDLDAAAMDCQVAVWAPGKIEKLTLKLEDGASPALVTYVKNRTTDATTVIDLIGDPKVAESFKGSFPAGNSVSGKEEIVLDFGFLYEKKYDLEAATNIFTITVEDKNGKVSIQQAMFKKN